MADRSREDQGELAHYDLKASEMLLPFPQCQKRLYEENKRKQTCWYTLGFAI